MSRAASEPVSVAPLLEVRGVTKRFAHRAGPFRRVLGSVHAVDGVSLAMEAGDILGLVGESGSGKTTLARVIAQLEPASEGQVLYRGRPLTGSGLSADVRRQIQLVFQDPTSSLDPRQRVGMAIEEPLVVHHLAPSASQRRERVAQLLDQVGLPAHYRSRYPRELSGGERQRVAIARALALQPALLILDEPVASLDVHIGAQVLELLRRLHDTMGLTYLLISHDLRVVGSLCRRIAVMYLGRIVELAPVEALLREPWHPYTELLLESAGLRPARLEDRGELPSPLHPPSGCVFRTRCPLAEGLCAEQIPTLREHASGRRLACHKRP